MEPETHVTTPPNDWTPQPAPAHLIIPTDPRDLREWEANEIDAPRNERVTRAGGRS